MMSGMPNIPMKTAKPVHPIKADALKPVVDKYKEEGKPFNGHGVSGFSDELRYWLAAGNINPWPVWPNGDVSG